MFRFHPLLPLRIGLQTCLISCPGCGLELAEHRENCLDADGKPLNTPR